MVSEKDPSIAAYAKVYTHADRLFDALEALEELGGIARAADAAGWSPKALAKALASLRATRDAIDGQLATIGQARRPRPAPRPEARHRIDPAEAAPTPSPDPDRAPLARRVTSSRTRP